MTLSSATTQGQSAPGSDGNERELCIPQSSSITEASPSDCLVSYPRHSLGESYLSADIQSVYSTVPADWAINVLVPKSVSLIFSRIPFKKVSEYFSMQTVYVFISLMKLLLQSLVSRIFLVLGNSYLAFSFIFISWCSLLISLRVSSLVFLQVFKCFPNWSVVFVASLFLFFI